ncbi:hypothetical protein NPX94_27565, partial [Bacillus wiedmannii]|uniref:hypothetical protein n=1 Tax=Bacillus wiedmannii TaxID=1890302 RepID=UPI0021138D06
IYTNIKPNNLQSKNKGRRLFGYSFRKLNDDLAGSHAYQLKNLLYSKFFRASCFLNQNGIF